MQRPNSDRPLRDSPMSRESQRYSLPTRPTVGYCLFEASRYPRVFRLGSAFTMLQAGGQCALPGRVRAFRQGAVAPGSAPRCRAQRLVCQAHRAQVAALLTPVFLELRGPAAALHAARALLLVPECLAAGHSMRRAPTSAKRT